MKKNPFHTYITFFFYLVGGEGMVLFAKHNLQGTPRGFWQYYCVISLLRIIKPCDKIVQVLIISLIFHFNYHIIISLKVSLFSQSYFRLVFFSSSLILNFNCLSPLNTQFIISCSLANIIATAMILESTIAPKHTTFDIPSLTKFYLYSIKSLKNQINMQNFTPQNPGFLCT